jgi:hypothetical protein
MLWLSRGKRFYFILKTIDTSLHKSVLFDLIARLAMKYQLGNKEPLRKALSTYTYTYTHFHIHTDT